MLNIAELLKTMPAGETINCIHTLQRSSADGG